MPVYIYPNSKTSIISSISDVLLILPIPIQVNTQASLHIQFSIYLKSARYFLSLQAAQLQFTW